MRRPIFKVFLLLLQVAAVRPAFAASGSYPSPKCNPNCSKGKKCTLEIKLINKKPVVSPYGVTWATSQDICVDFNDTVVWTTGGQNMFFTVDFAYGKHPFTPDANSHFSGKSGKESGDVADRPTCHATGKPACSHGYKVSLEDLSSSSPPVTADPKVIVNAGQK